MPKLVYSIVLMPELSGVDISQGRCICYMRFLSISDEARRVHEYRCTNGWLLSSQSQPELDIANRRMYLPGSHRASDTILLRFSTPGVGIEVARDFVRSMHEAIAEWAIHAPVFAGEPPAPPLTAEVAESLEMAEEDMSPEADDELDAPPPVDEFYFPRVSV